MILVIHVEKEETTLGYYLYIRKNVKKKYDIPTIIKTDKIKNLATESI